MGLDHPTRWKSHRKNLTQWVNEPHSCRYATLKTGKRRGLSCCDRGAQRVVDTPCSRVCGQKTHLFFLKKELFNALLFRVLIEIANSFFQNLRCGRNLLKNSLVNNRSTKSLIRSVIVQRHGKPVGEFLFLTDVPNKNLMLAR